MLAQTQDPTQQQLAAGRQRRRRESRSQGIDAALQRRYHLPQGRMLLPEGRTILQRRSFLPPCLLPAPLLCLFIRSEKPAKVQVQEDAGEPGRTRTAGLPFPRARRTRWWL